MDRLDAMHMFVRVVETGSFTKVAHEFATTQPTVTKQVAAMETRLKVRLLNRNTRGVSLTEAGALYYEKCKAIVNDVAEADKVVQVRQTQVQGQLRIGSSVAFGRRVLIPLALEFMTHNPWVLVASPTYLRKRGTPRRPSDLKEHATLIYSSVQGNDLWRLRNASGEPVSVPVTGRLRSNNLSALLAASRSHMGIAALPRYVAHDSLQAGRVVEVLKTCRLPEQEIHAVYPSPRLVPQKVQSFIAFLQGQFDAEWWETLPRGA
jgi:DNA-binding transcriptional LysR family regulator